MRVRPIAAAEAQRVRHPILRAGRPPEEAVLPRDDDAATVHLGAFDGDELAGVATFFPQNTPLRPGRAGWRLRGMATRPEWRGRGAGRLLVEEGIRIAREAGAENMWCHARVAARGFYEKLGFAVEGDELEFPVSGRHVVMILDLEASR